MVKGSEIKLPRFKTQLHNFHMIWVKFVISTLQSTYMYKRNIDDYIVGLLVPSNKLMQTKPSTLSKYSTDDSYGYIFVLYTNKRALHSFNPENLISRFWSSIYS